MSKNQHFTDYIFYSMNLVEEKIDISKLEKIDITHKPLIESLLTYNNSTSCENCFANLYLWRDFYGLEILPLGNSAVIYARKNGFIYFPIGKILPPLALANIVDTFTDANLFGDVRRIYNVPPEYPINFPDAEKFFEFSASHSEFDYVYDVDKQINLTGAKLRKKRNHIKRFFLQNPNWHTEKIDSKNISVAVDFMISEDNKKQLYFEESVIANVKKDFDALDLTGVLLYSDLETISAAAIIGKISNQTYAVHFEKSNKQVEGASQAIVKLEAEQIKHLGGKFMNREQDLGNENLRRAKESLDPDFLYMRLGATPKF